MNRFVFTFVTNKHLVVFTLIATLVAYISEMSILYIIYHNLFFLVIQNYSGCNFRISIESEKFFGLLFAQWTLLIHFSPLFQTFKAKNMITIIQSTCIGNRLKTDCAVWFHLNFGTNQCINYFWHFAKIFSFGFF